MDSLPRLSEEQFDIAIAFDGTWLHQGAPMTRLPLVRLFASVLQRDAVGDYWLITPAERGRIAVADAPFIAVSWRMDEGPAAAGEDGGVLYLTDNIGRETAVDHDHPLTLRLPRQGGGPFLPYHNLGGGLEARLSSAVYYALVDRALEARGLENGGLENGGLENRGPEGGRLTIRSAGGQHPLGIMS